MRGILLLLLIAALGFAGCDWPASPEVRVRVLGKVTWNGQPLRHGTLTFTADPARNSHQELATGVIHFDGTYELTTEEGLPPRTGWYLVSLTGEPGPRLPEHLADPRLSGLKATLGQGNPQVIDWHLPSAERVETRRFPLR